MSGGVVRRAKRSKQFHKSTAISIMGMCPQAQHLGLPFAGNRFRCSTEVTRYPWSRQWSIDLRWRSLIVEEALSAGFPLPTARRAVAFPVPVLGRDHDGAAGGTLPGFYFHYKQLHLLRLFPHRLKAKTLRRKLSRTYSMA